LSTILGEYIEIIRPSLIRLPQKTKIKIKSPIHTKTTINAKVVAVCVKTFSDHIYEIPSGSHIDVLKVHELDVSVVKATGWKLDTGEYLWR